MDFGFLNELYFGNSVGSYLQFIAWIAGGFLFKRFISRSFNHVIYKSLQKYTGGIGIERFYELLNKPLSWLIMLIILYIACEPLQFPTEWKLVKVERFGLRMLLNRGYELLISINIIWVLFRLIDFIGLIWNEKAAQTPQREVNQLAVFATEILKISTLIIGIITVLGTVFKLNVTSLIAGLGIGGLAVALAAKETLENILCSFIIFFDKPFTIGDLVRSGNIEGIVERIGFRSTRLRTIEKSYLTIPNRKMVDAETDNLSLRAFRRVRFNLGVSYDTTASQLKAIVLEIDKLLNEHPEVMVEGSTRFHTIGTYALEIRIEYFVNGNIWDTYLRVKEEVNFSILEIVEKHQAKLAFPTQTLQIEGLPAINQP